MVLKNKLSTDQLSEGIRSMLANDGYTFSKEDKSLLEAILVELEQIPKGKDLSPDQMVRIVSIILRFLEFFGIDDFTTLF